ncbi:hypothetical protein CRUP_000824 [Coryphaenoides rupestris]|nr:hypothetical protein CRUP_000824 [Coryphaenoides rupestris]
MSIPMILLTVVVIFRILIVAIVGEKVYEDEQIMFICNTMQPAATRPATTRPSPSPTSATGSSRSSWCARPASASSPTRCTSRPSSASVATPSCTRTWRGTAATRAKQRDRRYSFLYPILERDYGGVGSIGGGGGGGGMGRKLRNINGILVQHGGDSYFLYGFSVPGIFECDRYPCLKEVECYVSRPTEKTVFLVFMFAVSGLCVVLNLAELNHLGWRKIKAAIRGVQARRKSICEIRKKDMAHLSQPPNLGRTQSSESAYV